jgi:hypothetical protein
MTRLREPQVGAERGRAGSAVEQQDRSSRSVPHPSVPHVAAVDWDRAFAREHRAR